MAELLIGFAAADITPPLGSQMAGFDARKGVAESVHDPLNARALVLDDGKTIVALVSVEVIGVSAEFSAKVRQEIQKQTGIPFEHIVFSATHTHCGPVTIKHFFNQGQELDAKYLQRLSDGIVRSVVEANSSKKARRLRSGMIPIPGIAVNRRTENGQPIDPDAGVLLIEELDGSLAAIAVNYACHTTVLGPNTLAITGDFPHYMIERFKETLGPQVFPLYFNGAEGDLSIGHKSDLSAVGVIASFRTFEKAEELGHRLADAVLDGIKNLSDERVELRVERRIVQLPLKQYRPLSEMTKLREEAFNAMQQSEGIVDQTTQLKLKQRSLFSRIEEYYARIFNESGVLDVEMIGVRIGDTVVISLPGEVFTAIALNIRKQSKFPKTMFLGLANDYIGYVQTPESSASAGYEVVASRVTDDAAGVITQTAIEMIGTLEG